MLTASFFLTLALTLIWLPARVGYHLARYGWLLALIIALCLAWYLGRIEAIALLPIILFGSLCYLFVRHEGRLRTLMGMLIILFSLGLGLHLFPGFHNLQIVEHVQLSHDSMPYKLYFNFDKPLIGLFILYWLHPLIATRGQAALMLKQMAPAALLTLIAVLTLSLLIGYTRLDIKLPDFIGYWLWANLFFTCMAEEALFRGFMQRQLSLLFAGFKFGALWALLICALLFGIAHAAGGYQYVLLATLAGLGYGWVYLRTQRIEASILLHFLLNCVHIVFFSYPALRPISG